MELSYEIERWYDFVEEVLVEEWFWYLDDKFVSSMVIKKKVDGLFGGAISLGIRNFRKGIKMKKGWLDEIREFLIEYDRVEDLGIDADLVVKRIRVDGMWEELKMLVY